MLDDFIFSTFSALHRNILLLIALFTIFGLILYEYYKTRVKLPQWLKKRAKAGGNHIPADYEEQVQRFLRQKKPEHIHVFITYGKELDENLLGAHLSLLHIIVFLDREWLYRILFEKDQDRISNVYKASLWHEIGHTYKRKKCSIFRSKEEKRFAHWADEVHADFVGCAKGLDGNIEKALDAMNYKKNIKIDAGATDSSSSTHPSWNLRMKYIKEHGKFDRQLLEMIAKDAGLREANKDFLERTVRHYGNITYDFSESTPTRDAP